MEAERVNSVAMLIRVRCWALIDAFASRDCMRQLGRAAVDGRSPITSSPFTAWPHSHEYMRLRGGNHCAGRSRGTHPPHPAYVSICTTS